MKMTGRMALVGITVGVIGLLGLPTAGAAGATATRTVLGFSPTSPAPVTGQPVFLRAVVKPVAAGPAPTGRVSFLDGSRVLGTAPLAKATTGVQVAHIKSRFRAGSHSLTARYAGNTRYAASRSAAVTLVVARAATRLVITEGKTKTPGKFTIVAAVKPVPPGPFVPSGTGTFTLDSRAPHTVTLNSAGRGHVTTPLKPGSHTVTVGYSGDGNFAPSTGSLTFTV